MEINLPLPVIIHEDNQSAMKLLDNFENNKRCKHIDVKLHFVLDLIIIGVVHIKYICTDDQIADVFTKALGNVKFAKFVKLLNLF